MATLKQHSEQQGAPPEESARRNAPAFTMTLTIQSSATLIVGLAMLILGLLGGLYLRPLAPAQSVSAASATVDLPAVPASPSVTPPGVTPPAPTLTSMPPTATPQTGVDPALMAVLISKMRHFIGEADAPVTIIEFGDYQCPYCGRFVTNTWPQIDAQYVQSGQVRFGFWNFAFLGPESTWAAEAAECAADQGKFWEYHDKLYSSQMGENQGAFNKDNLKAFAAELGLDTQAFNACLDSGKYTALIQEDANTAGAYAHSAPTFLVNDQSIVGAKSFEVFRQVIELLLK